MPYVRIKTAGCDIYPHGSYHNVLNLKDGVYPTLSESDRIPQEWCEELKSVGRNSTPMPLFGKGTFLKKYTSNGIYIGYNLNEFRRMGYNSDGSKTHYFYENEYESFEQYMKYNNLQFK